MPTTENAANPLAGADMTCRADHVKTGERIRLVDGSTVVQVHVTGVIRRHDYTVSIYGPRVVIADLGAPLAPDAVYPAGGGIRVSGHLTAYVMPAR